jgi:hypothetical protein
MLKRRASHEIIVGCNQYGAGRCAWLLQKRINKSGSEVCDLDLRLLDGRLLDGRLLDGRLLDGKLLGSRREQLHQLRQRILSRSFRLVFRWSVLYLAPLLTCW